MDGTQFRSGTMAPGAAAGMGRCFRGSQPLLRDHPPVVRAMGERLCVERGIPDRIRTLFRIPAKI
jgi:hypothetical protein